MGPKEQVAKIRAEYAHKLRKEVYEAVHMHKEACDRLTKATAHEREMWRRVENAIDQLASCCEKSDGDFGVKLGPST